MGFGDSWGLSIMNLLSIGTRRHLGEILLLLSVSCIGVGVGEGCGLSLVSLGDGRGVSIVDLLSVRSWSCHWVGVHLGVSL